METRGLVGAEVEAFEEATDRYGSPEIFNIDQGCQFTSQACTDILKANNIRISMDSNGRWIDNVFIDRLWRSLKYSGERYRTIRQR